MSCHVGDENAEGQTEGTCSRSHGQRVAEVALTPSPRTLLPSNVAPWRGLPQAPALARPRKATLLYSGSWPVTGSDPSPPLRHLPRHCPSRPRSRGSPSASRPQMLRAHARSCMCTPSLCSAERGSSGEPSLHPQRGGCRPPRVAPPGWPEAGLLVRPAASEAGSCPGQPCYPACRAAGHQRRCPMINQVPTSTLLLQPH